MFKCFNGFYEWVNNNPDKVDPYLCAVYFAILNRANRTGWKKNFAIILIDLQEDSGINSRTTMLKTLGRLEEYGLLITISKTQNQYKNRVICLPLNEKHLDSTWIANEKHLDSTWTHNKTIKEDKDLIDFKEVNAPVFKKHTAWWTSATKESFSQKVFDEFSQHYPKAFLQKFIDFYSQEHISGGIHINHEMKFSLESKLRDWYNDPKTKERYPQSTIKRNKPLL